MIRKILVVGAAFAALSIAACSKPAEEPAPAPAAPAPDASAPATPAPDAGKMATTPAAPAKK